MNPAPHIFDRQQLAWHMERVRTSAPDFVTALVIDDLAERLSTITRTFNKALLLAPDTTHLPGELRSAEAPVTFEKLPTLISSDSEALADPEALNLPDTGYDLIVSLFDLAVTNDVPGFLDSIHRHLKPDGLFIGAFVGGISFSELRTAWLEADAHHLGGAAARIAPMIDTRDAGGLLHRAGFALPVADIETHTVRYADPLALMAEIKMLGASNPLAGRRSGLVTPAHLQTAIEAYRRDASDPDGRVRATLELIWLSGWSPHQSQQKPLKPGSAEMSLKDVLKPSKPS